MKSAARAAHFGLSIRANEPVLLLRLRHVRSPFATQKCHNTLRNIRLRSDEACVGG